MRDYGPPKSLIASDGVQRVIDHVDRLLAEGRLVAGERLPESEIGAELNIGRAQVREALRILAGDGVIDLKPNSGARVRLIDRKRMIEMLQVVNALLILVLPDYLTQRNLTNSLNRLDKSLAKGLSAPELCDAPALLGMLQAFNAEIIAGARNGHVIEIFRRIHFNHYNPLLLATLPHAGLLRLIRQNAQATSALRARDVPLAKTLLQEAYRQVMAAFDRPTQSLPTSPR